MNNTKQKILAEALSLFSERGFHSVSVKEIAEAVGIRDSTIYKHFTSKQEIFDTIIQLVSEQTQQIYQTIPMPGRENTAAEYAVMALGTLEELCYQLFMFYLQDEVVSKFRRMLTVEQYGNLEASRLFRQFFIEEPLAYEAGLFRSLKDMGVFVDADPEVMALHFYSPLFLMLSRFDHREVGPEEIRPAIKSHIEAFSRSYSKDKT
ncbi:TetR/AcrR family transcriptional regulator [Paenibacillus brevis]|uniref:TetR/AcrR family transcriptional regulator n=1 Tax=Paenibacillus brevis TaxID=2841508 RepID=A0ABS6FSG1_9BACL|nr:TetR/AcrR family transcriptional regulator [Paenibacillus brevis]MBU5673175.1 TetR/AcrR family transcriptional regulator [Paenibacillus brevis]